MKKHLTYAIAVFFASSLLALAGPDTAMIEAREASAWQAFKDKKADDFKKVVGSNMVGVYADGVSDMAKELADMKKWDMKSFALSDFKVHSDAKDVIATSYKVTLKGTFGGQDASGVYHAGSVWKMENGAWMAIFHTNMKAEGAATDAQKKE